MKPAKAPARIALRHVHPGRSNPANNGAMPARDDRQTLHVTADLAGKTLGEIVRRGLKISWSEAERRILSRLVAVHGNLCLDSARRLKRGDVVNVHAESMDKPPEAEDLEVVFQDRHLLIVDKPAGLVSVREPREAGMSQKRRERQPTLDELLARRLKAKQPPHKRFEKAQRLVYSVHRLDRDTSGLMLFARSEEAERELIRMFQAHDIERHYRAIVHGQPEKRAIRSDLVRDRGDGRRGSVNADAPPGQPTQHAITHVRPMRPLGDLSEVECRLETGRTHQIRIHLAEIGHPVCGDKTYGRRDDRPPPRQALHAATLRLAHPMTGRELSFTTDWPADMERWLRRVSSRPKRS